MNIQYSYFNTIYMSQIKYVAKRDTPCLTFTQGIKFEMWNNDVRF